MATTPKAKAQKGNTPAAKSPGKRTRHPGAEIHALSDPRDGVVRYIGKARDSTARLKDHLREMRRASPLYSWIAKLRRDGITPSMTVLCVATSDNWQELERQMIQQWREDSPRLLNLADGGDEPHCPPEVRADNARKNAAARAGDPFKKRLWEIKRFCGAYLKDSHVSEAAKERAREKMRYAAALRPDLFGAWASV